MSLLLLANFSLQKTADAASSFIVRACLMAPLLVFARCEAAEECRLGSYNMSKVELYFGAAGTAANWRHFLAAVVTPRFPDGLTELEGRGQWRGPRGLSREATHILVIYYKPDATSEARIEAIRSLYKANFRQASVLRADSSACVSF